MFKRQKHSYDKNDYEFMHSLSSAILEQTPKSMSRIIFLWLITVCLAVYWASIAEIDEIVRGNGEIVPSGNNQIIQNLEGGIVREILVQEGDRVVKPGFIKYYQFKIHIYLGNKPYKSNGA